MNLRHLTTCTLPLLLTAAAHAQVLVPVSQSRTISTTASSLSVAPDSDTASAPGFDPFHTAVTSTVQGSGAPCPCFSTATARQSTTINDTGISGSLSGDGSGRQGAATANSSLNVV